VPVDIARAKQWKELLVASGIDSQMLSCYGGYEDTVLRWAEVIPIWYLQKYIKNGLHFTTVFFIQLIFFLIVIF